MWNENKKLPQYAEQESSQWAMETIVFWIRIKLVCKGQYEHERDFHPSAESVFGL